MRKLAAVLGFALLMSASASAADRFGELKPNDLSARQLLQFCTPQGPPADAFCVGYIAGFVGALGQTDVLDDALRVCLPDAVTIGQVRKIVQRELRDLGDDPKYAVLFDGAAGSAAFSSLAEKFPCSEEDAANRKKLREALDTVD